MQPIMLDGVLMMRALLSPPARALLSFARAGCLRPPARARVLTSSLDRIPLSWPRWVTASRAATAIVAFAAAITTALLTAWIPTEGPLRIALVGLGAASSTLFARWVCRADNPSRAVLRSMGAGAMQSFFCGAVLAPLFILINENGNGSGVGLVLGFAIGATIIGVPFGGAVGLAYAIVPSIAGRMRQSPSHGDVDRVLTVGGFWLLVVAAVHAFVLALTTSGSSATISDLDATSRMLLASLWIVPLTAAVLLLAAVGARKMKRRRFLSAARVGEDAAFRIVPRRQRAWEPTGLLPLVHGAPAEACTSLLVRIGEPPREVLYRDAAEPEMEDRIVALIP